MLHELAPPALHCVVPLFDTQHLALVARAVACGNSPGRFWADNPSAPRVSLLWDGRHHLYLAGQATHTSPAGLGNVIARTILPAALAEAFNRYEAHAANDALTQLWTRVLPSATLHRRTLLARRTRVDPPACESDDPSLRLHAIDEALLQNDDLEHVQDVRNEVASMWGSVEAFLRKGFGYCAVCNRQLVCWCTAEYVSPGQCGIGIETILAYQRRGLATIAAAAFVRRCMDRDIEPYWDCWATNVPSIRVAEKVGFEPVEEFEVLCGKIQDLQDAVRPAR